MASNGEEAEGREILGVAGGVQGEEAVGVEESVCADDEVGKEAFGLSTAGFAAASCVIGEPTGGVAPDGFAEIEVDCNVGDVYRRIR